MTRRRTIAIDPPVNSRAPREPCDASATLWILLVMSATYLYGSNAALDVNVPHTGAAAMERAIHAQEKG